MGEVAAAFGGSAEDTAAEPFTSFICKVASRCNLDCDYCSVYHHADQSWRDQPQRMSLATAAQLGRRINEHAVAHGLGRVDFDFIRTAGSRCCSGGTTCAHCV